MIYLELFRRFFIAGLFAVGGGLATLPFLSEIGRDTGWFTAGDLANMVAVSESTPGPMGVNMATYVGYHSGGVLGGLVATLSLVLPSVIIMVLVAKAMQAFSESKIVKAVFKGLRPASMAMITAAGLSVAAITLVDSGAAGTLAWFRPIHIVLAAALFVGLKKTKLHPIVFIVLSAVAGALLQL